MKNIEKIKLYIPRKVYEWTITVSIILFLNIFTINMCSFLGCYDINFANIFRMNLLCNACTDISYQIQVHQIKIYFFLGGYFIKKMNEIIQQQIINITPSNN